MFEFVRDILKVVSPKEENERGKLQRKEGLNKCGNSPYPNQEAICSLQVTFV